MSAVKLLLGEREEDGGRGLKIKDEKTGSYTTAHVRVSVGLQKFL